MLKIGWIEIVYAYILGAPVKDKQGRVWQRPHLKKSKSGTLIFDPGLWGIDVSKWQGVIDWIKVKSAGIKFLIMRASYGITPDERFVEYINSAIGVFNGWHFGVYHYYDPRYSPQQQAQVLLAVIEPYKEYISRVWIDLEFTWSGNYTAPVHWQVFAQEIKNAGYEIGFYSRQTWWDVRVGDLWWWFAQFPGWVAQYSSNLTLIPKGWTPVIWQNGVYLTDEYFPPGALGSAEFDHDLMEQEFYDQEHGGGTTPPGDTTRTPFPGVTTIEGQRHGWNFSLDIIDPAKVRYEVVHPSPMKRGTDISAETGAQIVFNGGEWDRVSMPKDYSVSNGVVYVARKQAVPSFMVLGSGILAINHQNIAGTVQALSGLRYILEDGEIPSYLYGNEPQYTEGHSRSLHGLKLDGTHMLLTSEGAYPNQGLTLLQGAQLLQAYGCLIAFDSGGGGDVTRVEDGKLTNVPENSGGGQRYLPQFLAVYTDENGGDMPTVGSIKGLAPAGVIANIKRMSGGSTAVDKLQNGRYLYGEWSSQKTDIINFDHFYEPDGSMVMLPELCKVWAGDLIVTVEDEQTEPEPPPQGGTVWVKGIVEDKDENGNVIARYETDLVEAKKVS